MISDSQLGNVIATEIIRSIGFPEYPKRPVSKSSGTSLRDKRSTGFGTLCFLHRWPEALKKCEITVQHNISLARSLRVT